MTRLRRLAAALSLAVIAALVLPGTAHAVGYQFWGFYQLTDDQWGFASEGAGTLVPPDGTVDGYRFAVSANDDVRVPRAVLTFEDICADSPAEDGLKRIGVVVDPGRDVDAPEGEAPFTPGAQCVLADPDATSQEVLELAAQELRIGDSGLICGIGGFPAAGGCGDEVAEPTPEQLAPDEDVEVPVVAAGEPIIVPAGGDGAGQATDAPTTTGEPTGEDTTDAPTDDAGTQEPTDGAPGATTGTDGDATDPSTEQPTDQATDGATDEATDGATDEDPAELPADEAGEDEDAGGVPAWVWIAGALALVGVLAWVATSARNRRLEDAVSGADLPDAGDPGTGGEDGRPDRGFPGDPQGRR